MKIIPLNGNTQRLDGGAMFGNCPKVLWEKWHQPDPLNRIHLACRCLLIQTDEGKNVLFETGIGDFFSPKLKERFGIEPEGNRLLDELKRVGLSPSDIDQIVLSHLHFDHAGGMLKQTKSGFELLFPKADIFVGARHFERALSPGLREQASFIPELQPLLRDSGRLKLIEGTSHPELGEWVTFKVSDGHTPGLLLSEIETAEGLIVFCSDLVPGVSWVHLPIVMGYDRFPEKTLEEKRSYYEDWLKRKARFFFTHDPVVSIGTLAIDSSGKYFVETPEH